MYRRLWVSQHDCTSVRYRSNKWWVKRSKQGNISVPPAHLVLLGAGFGALTEVARLPRGVRVVRASLPAPPLPSLPLEQAAHRQCVVSSVTKTSTSSLLGALLQGWHQIMDQLVHRPAKVPGRGGGKKKTGRLCYSVHDDTPDHDWQRPAVSTGLYPSLCVSSTRYDIANLHLSIS